MTLFTANYTCKLGFELTVEDQGRVCNSSLGPRNAMWLPSGTPGCKGNDRFWPTYNALIRQFF